MDDEQATIESQFLAFAKLFDGKTRTGETITLFHSDYWLRQARLIDDRKITMTDTGILFNKYGKSEINIDEWTAMITELCALKEMDEEKTLEWLTNCGLPGEATVEIPQYRKFFTSYRSKNALEGQSSVAFKIVIPDTLYCNATYDGYLCWPPTPAGETINQSCPDTRLSDVKKQAYRRCGVDGYWLGRHQNDKSPNGWTNYTPCFPALVQNLFVKINDDEAEAQFKFTTATYTRILEMLGFTTSLFAILAAIFIFSIFRSLQNRRTIIHRNLFCALLMETTVRMWLYWNQAESIVAEEETEDKTWRGIENIPYICEMTYVLLEYSRLVVYAWMFIEGIFLNMLVSTNTLRNEIPIYYFYIGGWIAPTFVIGLWSFVMARHYSNESVKICWYGYNYLMSYYIIQGPILAIVGINFLFLASIMSVIINKLRRTNDSELKKIKKTIRATLILLPLLGIVNVFNLFDYPLDGSSTGFAIWAYVTHFFRSFQGVFISIIYCFTNAEVIKVVRVSWERRVLSLRERLLIPYQAKRPHHYERSRPMYYVTDNEGNEHVEMAPVTRALPSSSNISDPGARLSHVEVHAPPPDVYLPTASLPLTDLLSITTESIPPTEYVFCEIHNKYNRPMSELFPQYSTHRYSLQPLTSDSPRYFGRTIYKGHYSSPYSLKEYNGTNKPSSSGHTIPRTRRLNQYHRPGLVTRDSRAARTSVSSCFY